MFLNTRTHRQARNLRAAVPLEKPKTDSISPQRGGCSRVPPKFEFGSETGAEPLPKSLLPSPQSTARHQHICIITTFEHSRKPPRACARDPIGPPGTAPRVCTPMEGDTLDFFCPGKDPSRICRVQKQDLSVYLTRTTLVPQC